MTSTTSFGRVSATATANLLIGIAAQARSRCDPLQFPAHQRRAPRLDAAPAAERRDEARGGLRIDRGERDDKVRNQPVAFSASCVQPLLRTGERHDARAYAI